MADVCMEGFVIRHGTPYHIPSSPGAAGSANPGQSATSQCGWGFRTCAGRYRPWNRVFSSVCWNRCRYTDGVMKRGWDFTLPAALAPRTPANLQSASWVEVATPWRAVSIRGITLFVHGVDLQIGAWKEFSSGMGHPIIFHFPRVPLASPIPANRQSASVRFLHCAGQYRPGTTRFPAFVGVLEL